MRLGRILATAGLLCTAARAIYNVIITSIKVEWYTGSTLLLSSSSPVTASNRSERKT